MPYDLVRVKNVDKQKPLVFGDSRRHYELAPGKDVIVPWALAAAVWGDPHLMPSTGNPRARAEEFDRLRYYHGFYMGLDSLEVWLQEKCPKVQVATLEGAEIPMLIHDQFGVLPLPGYEDATAVPVDASTAEIQSKMASMQATIERLAALIEEREAPAALTSGTIGTSGTDGTLPPTPADTGDVRRDSPRSVSSK